MEDLIAARRRVGCNDIVVASERDLEILCRVNPYTLPDPEFVAQQINSIESNKNYFNYCRSQYLRNYKKRVAEVKINYLKEKMIQEFTSDWATRRHCVISIKNSVVEITKPRQLKYLLKMDLDKYFSYDSCRIYAYKNKIGVLKFNTKPSRDYYLTTGKYPYEIH